jgi:hypothetical protein
MPANPQVTDEMKVAALLALARRNIPTDIQGLLVNGNPMMDVPPGALDAAITAALADHVVVPREPTEAMIKAGFRTLGWTSNTEGARQDATSVYRAMISAASPSVSQEGE